MWSDRYYYLNIYKDELLSADFDTNKLREFISGIQELKQNGKFEFKNIDSFPYTQLLILKVKSLDNWSGNNTDSKRSNLISIVCEKGENVDFEKINKVFIKIASFLNWTLVDEETDDGVENFKIWEPN